MKSKRSKARDGNGFLSAWSFLTVVGRATKPKPSSMAWFPIAGALIGFFVGGIWWATSKAWPPLLSATITVASSVAITGALHLDGLADSADGLLPHMPRTKRLEVMAKPDIGAFGVLALVFVVVLQIGALSSIEANAIVLAALWATSRTAMAVVALSFPYARTAGLAADFLGGSPAPVAIVGTLTVSVLLAFTPVVSTLSAVICGFLLAAVVAGFTRRKIGGFTGDVLGAVGTVVETGGLIVVAAKW